MGIESLTERFRSVIVNGNGDKRKLMCAASLAHYGLLYSVARLVLRYVGLSRVPAQQLASLTSRVTSELIIRNVSGGYLVSLLSSLKCKWLGGRADTGHGHSGRVQWTGSVLAGDALG